MDCEKFLELYNGPSLHKWTKECFPNAELWPITKYDLFRQFFFKKKYLFGSVHKIDVMAR